MFVYFFKYRAVKDSEFENIKEQLTTKQDEINELRSKLKKKEKECNNLLEENEQLKTNINKLNKRCEDEELKSKNLEQNLNKMSVELESIVNLNSVKMDLIKKTNENETKKELKRPSVVKILLKQQSIENEKIKQLKTQSSNESYESTKEIITTTNIATSSPSSVIPKPPPLPPPLPPKGFGALNGPPSPSLNRNIPKSKTAMKCFNWSKIPLNNYDKTLWKNVNEENIYNILDLEEFQKTFSAYTKTINDQDATNLSSLNVAETHRDSIIGDSLSSLIQNGSLIQMRSLSNNDLSGNAKAKLTKKEFSVIDNRRARNCTILLSKLKTSNEELKNILLNMDSKDELPKDMIEQLLKFVPTVDEEALLEEHRNEVSNMAKADRFLYEMSKIYRYKQKLDVLYFKKKYLERYKEICKEIEAVTKCCLELRKNSKILKLLEIVLAFGNFMNQSHKKGVAVGFSIATLNKLIDIKSSSDRSFSMMHFLINTLQEKVKRNSKLPLNCHILYLSFMFILVSRSFTITR